jgi:hypothetical protein
MSQEVVPDKTRNALALLERITAVVLILVIASLGWMIAAAYLPDVAAWATIELQVAIVLALLGAALILVSVLALLHTRE